MTEDERMFNKLLQRNPSPGTKNIVVREGNVYKFPGWVFNESGEIIVKCKTVNREAKKIDCTAQIFYDILILGLIDISQRPKCKICGKEITIRRFSKGYPTTCGSPECIKEFARQEMLEMWKDSSYRENQTSSHKVWAEKEENKEFMRQRTLNNWKDPNYRERQVNSHIEWASKEENKELMRQRSLNMWKDSKYREVQSEVHKEFAKNNPDKVRNGINGTINITKSPKGEFRFDSTWERGLVLLLEKMPEVISIERPDFYIPYKFNGNSFSYFPDISVRFSNNNLYLIEVKAKWMIEYDPRTTYKINAGIEYVNNSDVYYKYLLLTDDQLCQKGKTIFVEDIAKEELIKLL